MDKAKKAFDFALKLTGSGAASTASCLYVVSAIRRAIRKQAQCNPRIAGALVQPTLAIALYNIAVKI